MPVFLNLTWRCFAYGKQHAWAQTYLKKKPAKPNCASFAWRMSMRGRTCALVWLDFASVRKCICASLGQPWSCVNSVGQHPWQDSKCCLWFARNPNRISELDGYAGNPKRNNAKAVVANPQMHSEKGSHWYCSGSQSPDAFRESKALWYCSGSQSPDAFRERKALWYCSGSQSPDAFRERKALWYCILGIVTTD
jgi:hypothetical protein